MLSARLQTFLRSNSAMAVGDQLILSAANFLVSFVLISTAGVEKFGVYSFLMVISMLATATAASILHGQMVLRVAGASARVQNSLFKSALVLFVGFYFIVGCLVGFLIHFVFTTQFVADYTVELYLFIVFTFLLSLSEMFRRFLYVLDKQANSFLLTCIYLAILLVGLVLAFKIATEDTAIIVVQLTLIIAISISILLNTNCLKALNKGKTLAMREHWIVLDKYWSQGKFAFLGMVITWFQNQGITPFLMIVGGPRVVGYFNIARLILMPVVVINTGLISSALPTLRRTFKNGNIIQLQSYVQKYANINILIVVFYFTVLVVGHFSGLLSRFIPDYADIQYFLFLWALVILAIVYRSWFSQQLIASMEFQFLLNVGVIAAGITFAGMTLVYLTTGSYYLIPVSVLLSECVLIVFIKRKTKHMT